MRIGELVIRNFRCFGGNETRIRLGDIACFIGANGTGKTAALLALCRLFGDSQNERRIKSEDFHVPPGESLDDADRSLFIEALLEFPGIGTAEDPAIAVVFRNMLLRGQGGDLVCRIRLEATYTPSSLAEGTVEEQIYWILSLDENPKEEHKRPLRPYQRDQIQTIYLPAVREPEKELKNVSGTILARILRAAKWSPKPAQIVTKAAEALQKTFDAEPPVSQVNKTVSKFWSDLCPDTALQSPKLSFAASELAEILKRSKVVFEEDGVETEVARLSDGWKSLFYFALVSTVFSIECDVAKAPTDELFSRDDIASPALTCFAVEEPENHLAPHYLSRIINLLRNVVSDGNAQVAITSHSPAVLGRIEPIEVRHFRASKPGAIQISSLSLPSDTTEAFKYVREAVRGFPELYFARVVILGEGASEQVVIPRLASALGIALDPSFVTFVPLGGRHVNHMWRLLSDLSIPHVTLLDLDLGRELGGWGRIKYACQELIAAGADASTVVSVGEDGNTRVLTKNEQKAMGGWNTDSAGLSNMAAWRDHLETMDVFFSDPIDLDWLMLSAFPNEYKAVAIDGPNIPGDAKDRAEYLKKAIASVQPLGQIGDIPAKNIELYAWYRYLFLGLGKPATHLAALASLADAQLASKVPKALNKLVQRVAELLK